MLCVSSTRRMLFTVIQKYEMKRHFRKHCLSKFVRSYFIRICKRSLTKDFENSKKCYLLTLWQTLCKQKMTFSNWQILCMLKSNRGQSQIGITYCWLDKKKAKREREKNMDSPWLALIKLLTEERKKLKPRLPSLPLYTIELWLLWL